MQIHGTHHAQQAHALRGPHFAQSPQQATASNKAQQIDQLDISPAAQAASEAEASGGIRGDLVARLRSEIASGTYETQEKLDTALSRLLDTIG